MTKIITPQTLKGFRDFLPQDALFRNATIKKIVEVFELFGFDPLETPALEYAETLLGKYGADADKLLYIFQDRGGRKVGLRYDQTVPLARVVAQYSNFISLPFKRYQIQPVWRAENTQKGRFREFLQCDIDIVGEAGLIADTEIIACVLSVAKEIGIPNPKILLNDRSVFKNLKIEFIRAIDKLKKIGHEGVIKDMVSNGADKNWATKFINSFNKTSPTPHITTIMKYLTSYGLKENVDVIFDPTLARGLDYYTSTIFELISENYTAGSLGGGGRYDKLIGQFTGKDIPAVGLAFGFDRIIDVLTQITNSKTKTSAVVLVTVFSKDLRDHSIALTTQFRNNKINAELWLNIPESDLDYKLDKQLKYADKKGIPYAVIAGPQEVAKKVVKLKDLKARLEVIIATEKLVETVKKLYP